MTNYWWLLLLTALLYASAADAQTPLRATAHITTVAVTNLSPAVEGKFLGIISGSLCIDATGATTGLTLQDTNGTNLVGGGIVYVLSPGQCWTFPPRQDPYFGQTHINPTAPGTGIDVRTSIAGGPVEVYLELIQR